MLVLDSVETGGGGDILKLNLSDGSALTAGAAYLPPAFSGAFLRAGAPVGPEAEAALRLAAESLAAERTALRLIARCEQCRRGLEQKLRRRGHGPEAAAAVLDRLAALDLLNDRRFGELWLRSRLGRENRGPRPLRMLLAARGLGREDAEAALEATLTAEAEAALLERCVKKAGFRAARPGVKPGGMEPSPGVKSGGMRTNGGGAEALRRFLKSQGFSAAVIAAYLEEAE